MKSKDEIPVWTEVRSANINGKKVSSLAITLRTKPCRFQGSTGSCKFCELRQNASSSVSADNLVSQVQATLKSQKKNMPEHIDLFGLGTFFDDVEMPPSARRKIVDEIKQAGIKSLLIESRAEYITERRLKEIVRVLSPIRLEVAIGIESTNPLIRETLLKKNCRKETLEKAISLLGKAKVGFLGYVLLKPPSVFDDNREKEAIEDAVKSAVDIFTLGKKYSTSTRVGLNPFYLPNKNQFSREELENYTLPSLWSVIEVLRRTHRAGTVFVGLNSEGLTTGPRGEACSCNNCTEDLKQAIREYNGSRNLGKLLSYNCECKYRSEREEK